MCASGRTMAILFVLSLSTSQAARLAPDTGRSLFNFRHQGLRHSPYITPAPYAEPEYHEPQYPAHGYGVAYDQWIPASTVYHVDDQYEALIDVHHLVDAKYGDAYDETPSYGEWPSASQTTGPLGDGGDGIPENRAVSISRSEGQGPVRVGVAVSGGYATSGTVLSDADATVTNGSTGTADSDTILDASNGGFAVGGTVSTVVTTPVATFGKTVGGTIATPKASAQTSGSTSSDAPIFVDLGK